MISAGRYFVCKKGIVSDLRLTVKHFTILLILIIQNSLIVIKIHSEVHEFIRALTVQHIGIFT